MINRIVTPVLFCILLACQEDQDKPPAFTAKGDINGFVKLHDENGDPLDDHSGAVMTLDENHKATSSASGKFELKDIPPGTYEITVEKEGYSNYKVFSFQFAGGTVKDIVEPVNLIRIPEPGILSYAARITPNGIETYGTAATNAPRSAILLFASSIDNVSNINYEYVGPIGTSTCCNPDGQFEFLSSVPPALSTGPIYVALYARPAGAYYGSFDYFNQETQKYGYSAARKVLNTVRVR